MITVAIIGYLAWQTSRPDKGKAVAVTLASMFLIIIENVCWKLALG